MVGNNDSITKIVVITKEKGKLIFRNQENWSKFKVTEHTLHSLVEPAFQEYGESIARFVWFKDGVHHRHNAPATYSFWLKKYDTAPTHYNHNFEFKMNALYHNGVEVNKNNNIGNVQLFLNGVKYESFMSPEAVTKFLHDSRKFDRGNKIREIFSENDNI